MTCHNRSPQKTTVSEVTGSGFFGGSVGKSCGQKREREREHQLFLYICTQTKNKSSQKKKGLTTVQSSRSNTILEDLKFQRTIFSFHCDTSFFRQCSMSVKYLVFEFSVTLQSFLTQSKMKSF